MPSKVFLTPSHVAIDPTIIGVITLRKKIYAIKSLILKRRYFKMIFKLCFKSTDHISCIMIGEFQHANAEDEKKP